MKQKLAGFLLIFLFATISSAAQLSISSFNPARGPLGTVVTINGSGFDPIAANQTVFFGGVRATIINATATQIQVTVPPGANNTYIHVIKNGLTVSTTSTFLVSLDGDHTLMDPYSFTKTGTFTSNGRTQGGLASGDLDGDGKLDIVAGNDNNTLSVLRNISQDTTIAFAPRVNYPAANILNTQVADVNADGKLDIILIESSVHSIAVFRNTSSGPGNISFAPRVRFATATNPRKFTICDLDGDGKAELISINQITNSFSILRNASTATAISFLPKIDFSLPGNPGAITFGDFDGDRKFDLAISYAGVAIGWFAVYRNTSLPGAITFATPVAGTSFATAMSMASGDLNADGKPDLVLEMGSSISILQNLTNSPNISFGPNYVFLQDVVTDYLALDDINGDGQLDIATITNYRDFHILQNVRAGKPFGSAMFQPVPAYKYSTDIPNDLLLADINGDGKPDMIQTEVVNERFLVARNKFNEPSIISFSPSTGGKGTEVEIIGVRFDTVQSVTFGGTAADSFIVRSPSMIDAVVGAGAAGQIAVKGRYGTAIAHGFNFMLPPRVDSLSPTTGSNGTLITLRGRRFLGATGVRAGATQAGSFTVVNDSLLTAVIGAGSTGPVTVHNAGGFGYGPQFVYSGSAPAPAIISFYPRKVIAGSQVTIRGNNFSGTTNVRFGNTAATSFTRLSDTVVVATVGLGASGAVTVTSPAGTASMNGLQFFTPPVISSFTPGFGKKGGVITLKGTGFLSVSIVQFGNRPAASFKALSDTVITAVIGSGASGNITVTGWTGTATRPGFLAVPVITGIAPAKGSPGTLVTITGHHFGTDTSGIRVHFGAVQAPVIQYGDSSLRVRVPVGATLDEIVVTSGKMLAHTSKEFLPTFNSNAQVNGQTFSGKKDYPLGPGSTAVRIGDIDGDGKPDLVGLNAFGTLEVYRNLNNTNEVFFDTPISFSTGSGALFMCLGDVDADGKPDVIVTNQTGPVSILRNTSTPGAISFAPRVLFQYGGEKTEVTVADFNGDGKVDIAFVNRFNDLVTILKNETSGTAISFGSQQSHMVGYVPLSLTTGDMDGDGKPDLAVSSSADDMISVFRNTSSDTTISFSTRQDYAAGDGPFYGLSLSDMDGDGLPDLVSQNYNAGGSISVLRNNSLREYISFVPQVTLPSGGNPYKLGLGDIDGDGKIDMLVTHSTNMFYDGNHISVFKNNSIAGTLSFAAGVPFTVGEGPVDIAIGDVTGDGKPEVATANNNAASKTISVLKNASPSPVEVCPGSGTTLTSDITGNSYQWQVMIGGSFVNLSNDANYSGVNSRNLVLNNIPASWAGNVYRALVESRYSASLHLVMVNGFLPTVSIAASAANICKDSLVTFTSTATYAGASPTYQWKVNGMPAGTNSPVFQTSSLQNNYQVSVQMTSNHACALVNNVTSDTIIVSVTSPVKPVISFSGSTEICAGDSLLLVSSAATGNVWSKDSVAVPGAQNNQLKVFSAGTYRVHNQTAGCPSVSSPVTVMVQPLPAAPLITASGSLTFCNGDSIQVFSNKANGNRWYRDGILLQNETGNSIKVKVNGSFHAIIDSGCRSAASNVLATIVHDIPATPVIIQNGNTLSSSAASGNQWYLNGAPIAGATMQTYIPATSGVYSARVSANGCYSGFSNNIAYTVTAVTVLNLEPYLRLRPNPVHAYMEIQYDGSKGICAYTLTAITGAVLQRDFLFSKTIRIPMARYPAGSYVLSIKSLRGGWHMHKVIIKH